MPLIFFLFFSPPMAVRSASKELKKKAPKKLKDLNAPKAPLTPYLKWGQEQREKDPEIKSLPVGQQGKKLSLMWQNVSDEIKEKYKSVYQKEKEAYLKEFEDYKKTDSYKEWFKQKEALSKEDGSTGKRKKRSAQSAYNVYFKEEYPIMASSMNTDGESKPSMKDVTAKVAEKWKSFSDAEKAAYQERADAINKEKKEAEFMSKEESKEEEEDSEDE